MSTQYLLSDYYAFYLPPKATLSTIRHKQYVLKFITLPNNHVTLLYSYNQFTTISNPLTFHLISFASQSEMLKFF